MFQTRSQFFERFSFLRLEINDCLIVKRLKSTIERSSDFLNCPDDRRRIRRSGGSAEGRHPRWDRRWKTNWRHLWRKSWQSRSLRERKRCSGRRERRARLSNGFGELELRGGRWKSFFNDFIVERIGKFWQLFDGRVDFGIRWVIGRMDSWRSRLGNSGRKRRSSWNCCRTVTWRRSWSSCWGRVESLELPVCSSGRVFRAERSSRSCGRIEIEQSKTVRDGRGGRVVTRDGRPRSWVFSFDLLLMMLLLLRMFLNFKCQSKFVNLDTELGILGLVFHFWKKIFEFTSSNVLSERQSLSKWKSRFQKKKSSSSSNDERFVGARARSQSLKFDRKFSSKFFFPQSCCWRKTEKWIECDCAIIALHSQNVMWWGQREKN